MKPFEGIKQQVGIQRAGLSALLLSAVFLLSGCVGPAHKPPSDAVAATRTALLAPMEPPPMKIDEGLPFIVPVPIFPLGMVAMMPLMESSKNGVMSDPNGWNATRLLVKAFEKRLAGTGRTVVLAEHYKPIPGLTNREITHYMENWLGPTRNWYHDTEPVLDYRDRRFSDQAVVLEIGVLNYELLNTSISVQTMVKVIRPDTGAVIGRTRAWSNRHMESREAIFANDSALLKSKIEEICEQIAGDALVDLGFLPPPPEK